jgi:hypothetical protein
MNRIHKRLSVQAVQDGVTYIVWINELDDHGNVTAKQQTMDGVMADSEVDAVNRVIDAITTSVYKQLPDATIHVGPAEED